MSALPVRSGHACAYVTLDQIGVEFETEGGEALELRLSPADADRLALMLMNATRSSHQMAHYEEGGRVWKPLVAS